MKLSKNIPFYLTAGLIFIVSKLWFTAADINKLAFLLKPIDTLFGLITGSQSIYIENYGYYHEYYNILIDKSCCGFNYFLICFLVFVFLFTEQFSKPIYKAFVLPFSLIFSWILTIFVNISRILISVNVYTKTLIILPNHQDLIHQIIGITSYLFFLLLTYLTMDKLIKSRKINEKSN
ncbi:MAG: exosortase K [Treponema sp.]|nr:exosortase K [Treponema sp.]